MMFIGIAILISLFAMVIFHIGLIVAINREGSSICGKLGTANSNLNMIQRHLERMADDHHRIAADIRYIKLLKQAEKIEQLEEEKDPKECPDPDPDPS